jgi:hypothetical protein
MMDCRVKPGNDTAEMPATFIYSARHARIVGQGVAQIVSRCLCTASPARVLFLFIRCSLPE